MSKFSLSNNNVMFGKVLLWSTSPKKKNKVRREIMTDKEYNDTLERLRGLGIDVKTKENG